LILRFRQAILTVFLVTTSLSFLPIFTSIWSFFFKSSFPALSSTFTIFIIFISSISYSTILVIQASKLFLVIIFWADLFVSRVNVICWSQNWRSIFFIFDTKFLHYPLDLDLPIFHWWLLPISTSFKLYRTINLLLTTSSYFFDGTSPRCVIIYDISINMFEILIWIIYDWILKDGKFK